ncbi:WD40 repeat-like protein [Morchella conica CCBAS932]|uniref:WD40 repeat-like protein n=1 Tax=Morchella conica CCBAS932 TaxID=1392247 RepID=A0A3N4KTS4_9PEZI|nr:WD40 repeat-like protein [Morchella conica CCBAS932]
MSKRPAEPTSPSSGGLKNRSRETPETQPPEMGDFEDNFEDEFESDDEVIEAGADGEDPGEDEGKAVEEMQLDQQVYMPSRRQLAKDEILEPDPSAYHMLHSMNVNWPCLSFDILQDGLGDERRGYPATVYLVTGTQAARPKDNEITVMKLSGLQKMRQTKTEEDEDSDSDDEAEDDPILESRSLPLPTTTNRIRVSPHSSHAASLAETGDVHIWDLSTHLASFDTPGTTITPAANKSTTLRMHKHVEGYAIDWSPHLRESMGKIVTGDNDGKIFVSTRKEDGTWATGKDPLRGHTGSIEELQWSPTERHVFASASSDGTVKIYDARANTKKHQLSVSVSSSDVNVASWCSAVPHLLSTGADDGVWGVWDLRTFPNTLKGEHVSATASFTFHQQPITSIEFHSTEDSIVAVGSADSTVTLWDLSVELDDEESRDTGGVEDVPPQLLFVHYCKDVKEVHWQKQAPGTVVATGADGFSVFKTISV